MAMHFAGSGARICEAHITCDAVFRTSCGVDMGIPHASGHFLTNSANLAALLRLNRRQAQLAAAPYLVRIGHGKRLALRGVGALNMQQDWHATEPCLARHRSPERA